MDDSLSFAVEIEERYKGIRAPHKLKGGVSGCVRECAEARGKDFGVIATDKGWNLFVCGNGGANPRHADLLASDLERKLLSDTSTGLSCFTLKLLNRLPGLPNVLEAWKADWLT